jgi:hypothetical protein
MRSARRRVRARAWRVWYSIWRAGTYNLFIYINKSPLPPLCHPRSRFSSLCRCVEHAPL